MSKLKEKKLDKKTSLSSKIVAKSLLRKSRVTLSIPEYEPESVLGDENRFFKGEMAKEKKAMFFD